MKKTIINSIIYLVVVSGIFELMISIKFDDWFYLAKWLVYELNIWESLIVIAFSSMVSVFVVINSECISSDIKI